MIRKRCPQLTGAEFSILALRMGDDRGCGHAAVSADPLELSALLTPDSNRTSRYLQLINTGVKDLTWHFYGWSTPSTHIPPEWLPPQVQRACMTKQTYLHANMYMCRAHIPTYTCPHGSWVPPLAFLRLELASKCKSIWCSRAHLLRWADPATRPTARYTQASRDLWPMACVCWQLDYILMAYIAMAYTVLAHIVMAYTAMAYIAMTYIVMAYIGMTYIVMAYTRRRRGFSIL